MGVAPQGGSSPTLTDTAEQLRLVLPQLSEGQLASFQSIVVSDNKTLNLDAGTFQRLDTAVQSASWSNHRGTNVVNEDGTPSSLIVSGSIDELVDNGILSASGIRNQELVVIKASIFWKMLRFLSPALMAWLAETLKLFKRFSPKPTWTLTPIPHRWKPPIWMLTSSPLWQRHLKSSLRCETG